ncbi:hypothetical protein [Caballeronia sp. DA-9]|uniref:hypothetical protein n=1 Tax=Caballeronia sp. DA-9 TaxID=3436237 RepID=UPI003F672296
MSMNFLHVQELTHGLERHATCLMDDMMDDNEPALADHAYAPPLSDERIAYLTSVRAGFDLLRDALSQVAAILLLIAAGSRDAIAHPMLAVAEAHAGEAREVLATLNVPRGAQHGHGHLTASLVALDAALRAPRSVRVENASDAMYAHVQRGLRELRFAAGNLPGLEIVSGAQACACHASPRNAE